MNARRRFPVVLAALVTALVTMPLPVPANAAVTETAVTIDGTKGGRTFDGIGAISGGGGNSRLLADYPQPYRDRILDYLFKPGYGAQLQMLKVEIGGDMNSTDGAEPSIMHSATDLNCDRGYEWWLMGEAKRRNPTITLLGLSWGAPGWIGQGDFWSTDMINYLLRWLGCARSHGLAIDYLGGWNENGFDRNWYVQLRSALDGSGYRAVKIVGADTDWSIADSIRTDPALDKAVAVIGAHYPCGGDGAPADSCETTDNALATGEPLWASENGSQDLDSGAAAMARAINRGYLDARMTAYLNWPLVAALPPGLPFGTTGLTVDNQPWSGAFQVGKSVWVAAHTTQFTRPGWRYVDPASGYLGGARANGSYVTLRSPNGRDYSTVIETTSATAAQTVSFAVTGGLSTGRVHIWATNLASADPATWFAHDADLTPANGRYSLTLQPGYVYTVSTVDGAGHGTAASPPHAAFGLPYADDFDGTRPGRLAGYLADQHGSFEVTRCGAGRAGNCLRQMTPVKPIVWHDNSATPYTVIGDGSWANYTVGADVMLEQTGSAELLGRFTARDYWEVGHINAYYLRVTDAGGWSIVKGDTAGGLTVLATGTVPAWGPLSWHHLALTFQDDAISAAIDGTTVGTAHDSSYAAGPAGLAVGVGDGGAAGGNLLGATGGLTWDGPVQIGVGQVPGTVTPATTPDGASAVRWTQDGTKTNTWIETTPADVVPGQTYRASVTLRGKGHVYLNFYNGQSDVGSTAVALTDQPQTLSVLSSVPNGTIRPVKFQIRTDTDTDVDLLASDASLVQQKPGAGWLNAQFDRLSVTPGAHALARSEYKLVNAASGRVLGVTADGTVQQDADRDAAAQHWQLIGRGTGYLEVATAGTGQVITGGGTLSAVRDTGAPAQQWRFSPQPDGSYTIANRRSDLMITGADGTRVTQQPANGGPGQRWLLTPAATANAVYALVNRNSGLTVDVAGFSTSDGGKVVQWTGNGGANQQWRLRPATDGYWKLANLYSGKVLEVPGLSTTPDTDVDQWTDTGGTNQQWQLVPLTGGYYKLVNRNSGLILDVWQSRPDAGVGLQQRADTGTASQQWSLVPIG